MMGDLLYRRCRPLLGMGLFLLLGFQSAMASERFGRQDAEAVLDSATGLTWQAAENDFMPWEGALAHCQRLTLGGNTDWRLPSIKELRSLVDVTRSSPAVDTAYFPDSSSQGYWSSTTRASSPNFAWYVSFGRGNVYTQIKTESLRFRCVR